MLGRHGTHLSRQRLHRSGTQPVRVLLIGDGGWLTGGAGATLARRALDRVWLTTRRGVDLDVLSDLEPVLQRVAAAGAEWRLWRYDLVVVLIDRAASTRRRARVLEQVGDLLAADARHGVHVAVLSGTTARHGDAGEEEVRLLRRAAAVGHDGLRLAEVHRPERGDEGRRDWAAVIAGEVSRALAAGAPDRVDEVDEEERQRALDATGVVGRPADRRFDDLVELARTAFGAESAEINFIDRDRQWKMAAAGAERGENPRAHSFCSETIKRADPLVVGDTRLHPVLSASPLARGPHAIRFYAAHPIESVDGHRIGSFCVYDSEPRDVRGLDLAVLRDLALLAQAELVAEDSGPEGAAVALAEG